MRGNAVDVRERMDEPVLYLLPGAGVTKRYEKSRHNST
jgi:hypothetical protein